MVKKNENIVIGIVLVAVAILLINQAQVFSIFSSDSFTFEKTVTSGEISAIAKSTKQFDVSRWEEEGSCNSRLLFWDLNNNVDGLSISLGSSAGISGDGCGFGPRFPDVDTTLLTTNLDINFSSIERIEMAVAQLNSIGCPDNLASVKGGDSKIFLVDEEDNAIPIFVSATATNGHPTSFNGNIFISKDLGDWVVEKTGGDPVVTEIPEGIYEIGTFSTVMASDENCGGGGGATGNIEIVSLNIIETEIEPPECTIDTDCSTGQVCTENICVTEEVLECTTDTDCDSGFECLSNECSAIEQDQNDTVGGDGNETGNQTGNGGGSGGTGEGDSGDGGDDDDDDDSFLDKLLGPTFILIIVITGAIFFLSRRKK